LLAPLTGFASDNGTEFMFSKRSPLNDLPRSISVTEAGALDALRGAVALDCVLDSIDSFVVDID
jgi:hypothetical protein